MWVGTQFRFERRVVEYTMAQVPLGRINVVILSLDTTTRGGSIAVVRDRGSSAAEKRPDVLALLPGAATRTHGERLPAEIAVALDRAGVAKSAIDLLAVATGPGAFTGLRFGLAAIQGLAMTLDRPVVGISALDALVIEAGPQAAQFIAPWMDAQRGEVFASLHAGAAMVESPIAASPATLLASWRARLAGHAVLFTGDAVTRDGDAIIAAGDGQWSIRVPGPLAPAIAELGLIRARDGRAGPPHALTPIYVRRPDPEIERERKGQA